MAYATVNQLRAYDRDFSSTDNDTDLIDLLDRSTQMMSMLTGLDFEASSDLRRFDSEVDVTGETLYLDKNLHSISSITNGDGATVSSDNYVTEPRNDTPFYAITLKNFADLVWEADTDGNPEDAIAVDGVWGYTDSDNTPGEIVHATLRIALILYDLPRAGGRDFDRPLITPEGVVIGSQQLPRDVSSIISHYRAKGWSLIG